MDWGVFLDEAGPWGLNQDFFLNLSSEFVGFVVSVVLISILVEAYRSWRERRRLKASRFRIAEDHHQRHYKSAKELETILQQILSGEDLHGRSLHKRMSDHLEAITRYYERNVYFLPPATLRHFEAYRAYYKNFVHYLRRVSEVAQGQRPMKSQFTKALTEFDFSKLDTFSGHFEKALGYKSPHKSSPAKTINKQIKMLLDLSDDALSRGLA